MLNTFYYCDISLNTSLFGKDKHCIIYISCLQYWPKLYERIPGFAEIFPAYLVYAR
jgi:hypothetical protein